jgi:hypothetical protein
VNGGQRALAKGQFPQKPAHQRRRLHKENFVPAKDKNILLVLRTGVLLVRGRPNGTTLKMPPQRAAMRERLWMNA